MELRNQLGVQPEGAGGLRQPESVSPAINHRGVLRERSANEFHENGKLYTNRALSSPNHASPSQNRSENAHQSRRPVLTRSQLKHRVHAHQVRIANVDGHTPEKQVNWEVHHLYHLLDKSEKYRKYREKQPNLTVSEVIERDAIERARALRRKDRGNGKKERDRLVWPEFLERAFWRAIIRYPPMGRSQQVMDGQPRGRNELISASIFKETRIERDRKQVSSHIQVLKKKLDDIPEAIAYLSDSKARKIRLRHQHHRAHIEGAQRTAQPEDASDVNTVPRHCDPTGQLPSGFHGDIAMGGMSPQTPYAITDFKMFAEKEGQPVHAFTSLSSSGRLDDLDVRDMASWQRRNPEFDFLNDQVQSWVQTNRAVLLCDATVKIMTEARPKADLSIVFNLSTPRDLLEYSSIECTTRFYDSGKSTPDPQLDGSSAHDLKEHRTSCEHTIDATDHGSHLRIAFGSRFWAHRMLRYQVLRHRKDFSVPNSLRRLTATQNVYGIRKGSGEADCLLTILWRFSQTRSTAEVGCMNWRSVNFHTSNTDSIKCEDIEEEGRQARLPMDNSFGSRHDCGPESEFRDSAGSHDLDFGFGLPTTQQHQGTYNLHEGPSQLPGDIPTTLQSPGYPESSTAPSASIDFSIPPFPSLGHSHATTPSFALEIDYNFDGGHIVIAGAFNNNAALTTFDDYRLEELHTHPALSADALASFNMAFPADNDIVSDDLLTAELGAQTEQLPESLHAQSVKPLWSPSELIDQPEFAAENYGDYLSHDHQQQMGAHGQFVPDFSQNFGQSTAPTDDLVAQGLHDNDNNLTTGLWRLQSPFQEDTAAGAEDHVMPKEESMNLGFGVLEMIERDQRAREY